MAVGVIGFVGCVRGPYPVRVCKHIFGDKGLVFCVDDVSHPGQMTI